MRFSPAEFSHRVVAFFKVRHPGGKGAFLFLGCLLATSLMLNCGMSLECLKDEECPKDRPFCVAGDCKQCTRDRDCNSPYKCDLKTLSCTGPRPEGNTPGDGGLPEQGGEDGQTGPCRSGQRRSCYSGPEGTEGVGACRGGVQSCSATNAWGACTGEVVPGEEKCDRLDNNCDGKVDEGCSCVAGTSQSCGVNRGECRAGRQSCAGSPPAWGTCIGQREATEEVCDGKDNNCDGQIDEDLTRSCYSGAAGTAGKGDCKEGKESCTRGRWSGCVGQVVPQKEICDGKDNDCDGQIDESLTRSCYSGSTLTLNRGECKAGTQTCTSGAWSSCVGEVTPKTEICDKKDNDCDNRTDEGCACVPGDTLACGSSVGECKAGKQTCSSSTPPAWGACVGQVSSTAELCDNKDNDCDGKTDEELTRPCYTGPTGTAAKGSCKNGTQACTAGAWGTCQGEVKPTPEICDGQDNNCDGQIDEGTVGCVSTIAGDGAACTSNSSNQTFSGCDKVGDALNSSFADASDIAVDPAGNIYLSDSLNHVIRKLSVDGKISVFAGDGKCRRSSTVGPYVDCYKDGPGAQAQFRNPGSLVVDDSGNLYVADSGNHLIRKITPAGVVSTFAGSTNGYHDGTASQAKFNNPTGLALDASGNLYVADRSNHRIRKINTKGDVTTIAGKGIPTFRDHSNPLEAYFYYPSGIAVDANGTIFVADQNNNRIRKIDSKGVSTYAGSSRGFRNGASTLASFYYPRDLHISSSGVLYVVDQNNYRIRKINALGNVTTLAGSGTRGYKDGPAQSAGFSAPSGIALDADENVYIADGSNRRFRKLTQKAPPPCTKEGSTQSCYSGDPKSAGKGVCKNGLQTCKGGFWSLCANQVLPKNEECNGLDDDCDGQIDNNLTQAPLCSRQSGGCAGSRSLRCTNGKWEPCTEADYKKLFPQFKLVETCDRVDENCDGLIDESATNCVTTLAGGTPGYQDGQGSAARFNGPAGVAVDPQGNVYVADRNNHRIRKIDPAGNVTFFSGSGSSTSRDGSSTRGSFDYPQNIALDSKGTLYITERNSNAIRKVAPDGTITTLAGSSSRGSNDGTGSSARFYSPAGLTLDSQGNVYVADRNNHTIRKITPSGTVTTLAGDPGRPGFNDAKGSLAKFSSPQDVALDHDGNLYVADTGNRRIRKITPDGTVTTLAGNGGTTPKDGPGTTAQFGSVIAIARGPLGDLFVLDNSLIRKVKLTGEVSSLAGSPTSNGFLDGPATQALFYQPSGLAIDSRGNLYIAGPINQRIRMLILNPPAACTTEGGTKPCYTGPPSTNNVGACKPGVQTCTSGFYSFCLQDTLPQLEDCNGKDDDCDGQVDNNLQKNTLCTNQKGTCQGTTKQRCSAGAWQTCSPSDISSQRSTYNASETCDGIDNNCNGKVDEGTTNCVITLAGSSAGLAEGIAESAKFSSPAALVLDASGNIYVADRSNHRIRKINTSGNVSTFAGSNAGYKDGTGAAAQFTLPTGIAIDASGNLYISDGTFRIRKITPAGVVSTLAGKGYRGFVNGPATTAQFDTPTGLAVDSNGNVFVADTANHAIRKIDTSGNVTTIAGNGTAGFTDGAGAQAQFNNPSGIALASNGDLYVADRSNHRIRKITPAGVVSTFAGTGSIGATDGPVATSRIYYPSGLFIDNTGSFYLTEGYSRIRKITAGIVSTLSGSTAGDLNGPPSSALFRGPLDIALDSKGNPIIADTGNHRIRAILFK